MIKDSAYLSEKEGISSASANHLRNIANEIVRNNETYLKSIQFMDTDIDIVGTTSGKKKKSIGSTKEDLLKAKTLLKENIGLLSLAGWFNEGIDAKNKCGKELESISFENWAKENITEEYQRLLDSNPGSHYADYFREKDYPLHFDQSYPDKPTAVTLEDIISGLSIKDRAYYLFLEQSAAKYGQAVHKDGYIKNAKDDFHEKLSNPIETDGQGRDTLLYYYTPTMPSEDVDGFYEELQALQRGYEAQLNSLKFQYRQEAENRNIKALTKYQEDLVAWNEANHEFETLKEQRIREFESLEKTYDLESKKLTAKFNEWKTTERTRISRLKIVIPEKFKETYEKLNSLGSTSDVK